MREGRHAHGGILSACVREVFYRVRAALPGKKIHRAGGAFVPRTCWPSACAYQPPGPASTYSRSVLGARRTLRRARIPFKGTKKGKNALCTFSISRSVKWHFFQHALKRWDQKNSPTRLHFRPPNQLTFRLRVRPLGSASTYLRSVVGASGNLLLCTMAIQGHANRKSRSLRRPLRKLFAPEACAGFRGGMRQWLSWASRSARSSHTAVRNEQTNTGSTIANNVV